MHRSDLIEKFIKKVNNEAEEAARKVFDAYQNEFEALIRREKLKGKELHLAMGSAYYRGLDREHLSHAGQEFLDQVARVQYTEQHGGFNVYFVE